MTLVRDKLVDLDGLAAELREERAEGALEPLWKANDDRNTRTIVCYFFLSN